MLLTFGRCTWRNSSSGLLLSHQWKAKVHHKSVFVRTFSTKDAETTSNLVYEAPMARTVRIMKGVSVTSCSLTTVGMPILCYFQDQVASNIAKWAMCGTLVAFGFSTTSLFHYLFKPYVVRMWLEERGENQADPQVTVETLTLFAQFKKDTFALSDVTLPDKSMHPMISFKVKSTSNHYFIHPECFEDVSLAKRLMGKK